MKHTPAPWRAFGDSGECVGTIDYAFIANTYAAGRTSDECEANAARIAVCVNACEPLGDDPAATLQKIQDAITDVLASVDEGSDTVTITKAHTSTLRRALTLLTPTK